MFLSSNVTYRLSGNVCWASVDFPLCLGLVMPTTGNCEARRRMVSFVFLLIIFSPEILKLIIGYSKVCHKGNPKSRYRKI
jgi:hypothetical protein